MSVPPGALLGALLGLLAGAAAVAAVALGPLRILAFFLTPVAAASTFLGAGLIMAGLYLHSKNPGSGRSMGLFGAVLAVQFMTPIMALIAGKALVAQAQDWCEASALQQQSTMPLLGLSESSRRYPLDAQFDENGDGRCSFADPYGVRSFWLGERTNGVWIWENLMD